MNQFWLFLIIVGISVISSVVGKLKEQAEIKKANEAKRRRYEEQLRTGPTVQQQQQQQQQQHPTPATRQQLPSQQSQQPQHPATAATQREARLQEIRERRQAELRELRERQARMRQQQQPAPPSPGTPARREAKVIRPGAPRPQQQPSARHAETPDPNSATRDMLKRREREREREITQTRENEAASQKRLGDVRRERDQAKARLELETQRISAASALDAQARHDISLKHLLTGGSIAGRRKRLRQIMAMNEVFAKPVSQRRNHLER